MNSYKVLKIPVVHSTKLELKLGGIFLESTVNSMCSQDFDTYDEDDGECEGDCIDCLVKYGIVELVKDRYSIQGGRLGCKKYDTLEELLEKNRLDLDDEQIRELMQEGEIMSNEFIIHKEKNYRNEGEGARIDIG